MSRPALRSVVTAGLALGVLAVSAAAFARGGVGQLPPADPLVVKDDPRLIVRWVYDDLERGFAQAKKSGRPLLIVFR